MVFYSSDITIMHGPTNIKFAPRNVCFFQKGERLQLASICWSGNMVMKLQFKISKIITIIIIIIIADLYIFDLETNHLTQESS